MKSSHWKTYLALILAMVGWALSFVWFKVALPVYGPLTVVFLRLLISAALLFIFLKVTGKFRVLDKKNMKLLLLLAFFEPFLYFLGESFGLKYISSTLAAVIIATIPLFAPIPARIFHNEHPSGNFFTGATLSLIGVILVAFQPGLVVSGIGIGLEFLAVLAALGYSTVLKKVPNSVPIFSIIFYQSLIGSVYFLPFWLIFEAKETFATPFHTEAFIASVELAVVASVFAFVLFTYGLRRIGMSRANVFVNAIPGFTAVFAWLILGDAMSWHKIGGLLLLAAGLWLAQRKKISLFKSKS
ncbi:MAG: DMT family transporter [Bacteroidales bacterium]|jgi:drug/metabolite transporter (DMT)-like permease|nr:DMT family transporter [Bacteroidales bacterium]